MQEFDVLSRILIISIIGILAILSFIFALHHISRYDNEIRQVNLLRFLLRDCFKDNDETKTETEEITYYKPKFLTLEKIDELRNRLVNKSSLVKQRIDTIYNYRRDRLKINIDLLDHLTLASEESEWTLKFPGYAGGISILLGMLGTFIGLAIVIQGLDKELSNITNILDQSLKTPEILSGVKTAFYTTLVGLISAVLSFFLNFSLENSQTSFFKELKYVTIKELLPVAIPPVEEGSILEQATFSLEETTKTISNRIKDLDGILGNMSSIIQEVRRIAQPEISLNLTQVIGELIQVNQNVKKFIDSYNAPEILQSIQSLRNYTKQQIDIYNRMLKFPKTLLAVTGLIGFILFLSIILFR